MPEDIKIKTKIIGKNHPTFIIAEIGMTHDGSFGQAVAMMESAARCGVDAVKFQMHISEAETTKNAPPPPYFTSEPRYSYFKRTAFSLEQWKSLKKKAEELGLVFICSSFSIEATEILDKEVGVEIFKVPAGEVTNLFYLEDLAKRNKPILLSTGMSNWEEIDRAVDIFKKENSQFVVLQCSSEYPCQYDNIGLNVLGEIKNKYGCHIGLSDHSLTVFSSFAAVLFGALVVEKHFTLSKEMYGPDAKYALEPKDLKQLVDGIRSIEIIMKSQVDKDNIQKYKQMKEIFQKSLVTKVSIPEGSLITKSMLTAKKPGTGIEPKDLFKIVGKRAKKDMPEDYLISTEDVYE